MRHIFFKHPPRAAVARLTCLGSHKALGILFPVEAEAMTWLKGPHRGEVFGGQAPLGVMIEGGLDGILTVRRYLDGWRGGLRGGPGKGADIEPGLVFAA